MSRLKDSARDLYLHALGVMPARWALRVQFVRAMGYNPHFRRPRTFSERLQARKLRVPNEELYARLADKLAVKAHVAKLIGEQYLIPTLWSGPTLPPRAERTWPIPFVLKANHGSGLNHFVRDAAELDWAEMEALSADWMVKPWQPYLHEHWYDRIPRQLLVEPLIGNGPLNDYKLLVFNGRVHFVQVDSRRFTDHRRTFFSPLWELQPFRLRFERETDELPRPPHLRLMIELAERLGAGFDFVRVDFYDLPDGPLFGEMTFTPGAGCDPFYPPEYDLRLGELWPAAAESPEVRARGELLEA
ncbi:MAG: hypothetical protein AVDCRST_MAG09-1878 [uncultured Sphingomonas sp.]|uniref:Uncharacterized protein n=2 Tax=uncultured Sphingomonas sp. TaxID=158754 RepID=A0A6J4TAN7_9SPHN|nr:MAG: hypothetical protein AVDCRST_MAG09-1878 [uncultured Sphingomonas sp.]